VDRQAANPFDALADPQRRAIVELLHGGERSVRDATKHEMAVFPTRVVALPDGRTAYTFTMFQSRGMPDELFESQHQSLQREFGNIEQALS
jgi:hypothetical protein